MVVTCLEPGHTSRATDSLLVDSMVRDDDDDYVKYDCVNHCTGDKSTCRPYEFKPCAHHSNSTIYEPCGDTQPTPKCVKSCENGKDYEQDKIKASRHYSVSSKVEAIQTEIMTNGPVEAAFKVYNDFLTYKSGVYRHVTGSFLGGHAIKIIGWGVEEGTKYWLVCFIDIGGVS